MFVHFVVLLLFTTTGASDADTSNSFDISNEFQVTPVIQLNSLGGRRCYNTAAAALVSALEIAYTNATGHAITFSVQEILDCYHSGCGSTRLNELVAWLQTMDRLAPASKYDDIGTEFPMCRAAFSPDGLDEIKVTGLVDVTTDDFEVSIRKYGSILVCYDYVSSVCPQIGRYAGGIVNGFPSAVCRRHAVIVGFTETYYRVKESSGSHWGEEGYFRILRGDNHCGIENSMKALVTEVRTELKLLDPDSGCIAAFPIYCPETKTCAAEDQDCLPDETEDSHRNTRDVSENAYSCEDTQRYRCEDLKAYCKHDKIKSVCGRTCNVCGEKVVSKCIDRNPKCNSWKSYCNVSLAIKALCPVTCGMKEDDCGTLKKQIAVVVKSPHSSHGKCYAPVIKNGKVLNTGVILEHDEELMVECDEGYAVGGHPNICVIQNVYGPDSRVIQQCVKTEGESFTAKGVDYTGTMSVTLDGQQCDFWYSIAYEGKYSLNHAEMMMSPGFENHNFCRNFDGVQPVPYCYAQGWKEYCYSLPGCGGVCEDAIDEDGDCEEQGTGQCLYSDEHHINAAKSAWKYCTDTCCMSAGC